MTAAVKDDARTTNTRSSDIFQISLGDESGQSILSIDDGALRQSLQINIVNTSGKSIELKTLEGVTSPSQTNYHFCISFRPGTLAADLSDKPISLKEVSDGWKMVRNGNDFYLLRTSSENKVVQNEDRITLTLENIGAAPAGGSRGTRVEVKYNNLQYQDSTELISGTRLHYLNIVNHRGKKQVPLYVDFWGSNTILNDNSENELTLSIQVLPRLDDPSKTSKVSTSFEAIDLNLQKLTPKQVGISQKIVSTISSIKWDDLTLTHPQKVSVKQIEDDLKPLVERVSDTPLTLQDPQKIYEIWQEIYDKLKEVLKNISNADKQKIAESLFKQYSEQFGGFELVSSQQDLETILFFLKDLEIDVPSELLSKLSIITKNQNLLSLKGSSSTEDGATKFTISFDVAGSSSDSSSWALTSKEDASNIEIQPEPSNPDWTVTINEQGISPQWSITCKNDLDLTSFREILRLSITNIKTTLLSGSANLYFHYENIPGYWDGFITVPIHKGPLVYREYSNTSSPSDAATKNRVGCVGIGTGKPQAKLHVKGQSDFLGLRVEGSAHFDRAHIGIGEAESLIVKGNTEMGELKITPTDLVLRTSSNDDGVIDRIMMGSNDEAREFNNNKPFVLLKTSEQDATITLKARGDRNKWEIKSDSTGELYGSSSLYISNSKTRLTINDSGGVGIGTPDAHIGDNKLKVLGNTTIIGNLSVTTLEVTTKPIIFKRYQNIGDNPAYRTGFSSTDYFAAITGFNVYGGDIDEGNGQLSSSIIKVYMKSISNIWHIVADFRTQTNNENWSVDVMFVSNKIAKSEGNFSENL